jgi:acetyltransferase-like isoleucine patch superfamily enzyme
MILNRAIRFFYLSIWGKAVNTYRILKIKTLYPSVQIDFKTIIGKNCSIFCCDSGRLIIRNSQIGNGTFIFADEYAYIEIKDTFINRNCVLLAKESITVDSGCAIAEMVVIRDQNHILDPSNALNPFENYDIAPIKIGKNVWIASKASILKGATLEDYTIIAASAVVNTTVPTMQVWGGIPAKFIKMLK